MYSTMSEYALLNCGYLTIFGRATAVSMRMSAIDFKAPLLKSSLFSSTDVCVGKVPMES